MKRINQIMLLGMIALLAIACEQAAPEAPDYAAMITKANEEMLNKGNLDYADSVFAATYADQGPEMIKTIIGQLRTAFPDLKVEVDGFVQEGDLISWRRTHTGTHQGEIFGFAPSGKELTWTDMITSRYNEEGLVTEEWGTGDLGEKLCANQIPMPATEDESGADGMSGEESGDGE